METWDKDMVRVRVRVRVRVFFFPHFGACWSGQGFDLSVKKVFLFFFPILVFIGAVRVLVSW